MSNKRSGGTVLIRRSPLALAWVSVCWRGRTEWYVCQYWLCVNVCVCVFDGQGWSERVWERWRINTIFVRHVFTLIHILFECAWVFVYKCVYCVSVLPCIFVCISINSRLFRRWSVPNRSPWQSSTPS